MWDFEIGRTLGVVLRTWPFVLMRMVVYFGITAAYVLATSTAAGVGYGTGHVFGGEEGPVVFAFWGGAIGFGLVSIVLYWLREYILYVVKAAHVAVMVHLVEGRPVPGGQGQIAYGRQVVTARFLEANLLFALDQLVKGAIRAITGILGGFAAVLPVPGLQGLIGFMNAVIRISLTYVDEIILAYNVREDSTTPYETAQRAVVLYAQNGVVMLKNAVWLALMVWVIGIVIFLFSLAPAAAILYAMPGELAGWSFVLALLFAWAAISAFVEPFAIAALMQVYFRVIEGQVPDPVWDDRLTQASRHFRELKDQAMASFRGRPGAAPAA